MYADRVALLKLQADRVALLNKIDDDDSDREHDHFEGSYDRMTTRTEKLNSLAKRDHNRWINEIMS